MASLRFYFISIFSIIVVSATAQNDTLPNFNVKDLGKNRIQVSWINPYSDLEEILVQRSFDSTKGFRTIFKAQTAWLPANGFVDTKITSGARVYYRILFTRTDGNFTGTKSKRPTGITYENNLKPVKELNPASPLITIIVGKAMYAQLKYDDYAKFKDSIINNTKDKLIVNSPTEVELVRNNKVNTWQPSRYIYTNKKGYVTISLPKAGEHKYRIVFKDKDGADVFEIKHVRSTQLQLDKSNFIHSGWFTFDLYENDKHVERNKVLLAKDF